MMHIQVKAVCSVKHKARVQCKISLYARFYFFLVSRQLCPLPEGRLVVQLLCTLKSERSLVQRRTLPQPLPRRGLLGGVQRGGVLTEEGGHDDPAKPEHLPLSIRGSRTVPDPPPETETSTATKTLQRSCFMEDHQTEPRDKDKHDVESAISNHQADGLVPPDDSKEPERRYNHFPSTYDSVETRAHCSGVVLNTLSLIRNLLS